jgi:hypothetical protein
MPVKQTIPYNSGMFFITFTCYKWLPLIEKVNGYNLFYNWFDLLAKDGHPSPPRLIALYFGNGRGGIILNFRYAGKTDNTI